MRSKQSVTVTIAAGASLSGPISTGANAIVAITIPAAWTAAALSFQASDDGGTTWYDMFDDGGQEVTVMSAAVVAGQRINVDPGPFYSVDYIKVRSGLTGAPVNQAAARTLTLTSKHFYSSM